MQQSRNLKIKATKMKKNEEKKQHKRRIQVQAFSPLEKKEKKRGEIRRKKTENITSGMKV